MLLGEAVRRPRGSVTSTLTSGGRIDGAITKAHGRAVPRKAWSSSCNATRITSAEGECLHAHARGIHSLITPPKKMGVVDRQ